MSQVPTPAVESRISDEPRVEDPRPSDWVPSNLGRVVQDALTGFAIEIDAETIQAAVQAALGEIVVEVDAEAIAATVRQTVGAALTEVATRTDLVALQGAQLTAASELPSRDDLEAAEGRMSVAIQALAAGIASTVTNEISNAVNTLAVKAQGAGALAAQAILESAAEHLQVQLEGFHDRIRAGTKSLEALADELAARERSAASLTDQLASSVEASLGRLADRVDRGLAEMTMRDTYRSLALEVRELTGELRILIGHLEPEPSDAGPESGRAPT